MCGGDDIGASMEVEGDDVHCDLRMQGVMPQDQGYYMCMLTGEPTNHSKEYY